MSDQVESEMRLRCCARPVWGGTRKKVWSLYKEPSPLLMRDKDAVHAGGKNCLLLPAEKNKGSKCGINHAVTFSSERVLTRQCSPSERLATRGRKKKTLKRGPSGEAKRSRRCCLNPGERSILKYAFFPPLFLA